MPPPAADSHSMPDPRTHSEMCVNQEFSPQIVLPLSKYRFKKSKCGKALRKSAILMDTPEKEALENEYKQRKLGPKTKGKELKAAKIKGTQEKK